MQLLRLKADSFVMQFSVNQEHVYSKETFQSVML